jgi:hypothetical protein
MKTKIVIAIIVCAVVTLSFTSRSLNSSQNTSDKVQIKNQASSSEPVGGLAIEDKF